MSSRTDLGGPKVRTLQWVKVKKAIEARGGKSVLFPDLADRVADGMYSGRLSLAEAWKTMPIGNRAELRRWLEEVDKVLPGLLDG